MKRIIAITTATAALALFPLALGLAGPNPLSPSPHHLHFHTVAGVDATPQEVIISLANTSEPDQVIGTVSTSTCPPGGPCFGPFYVASDECSGLTLSGSGASSCSIFVGFQGSVLSAGHYADTLTVLDNTAGTSVTVGLGARVDP